LSSVRDLLRRGTSLLEGLPPPFDPPLEARLLLQKTAGLDEAAVWTGIDTEVPSAAESRFLRLIARRRRRVPLAYLTGEREFWSLPFRVAPGVLVPRPETEILVETALGLSRRGRETIVDIGTGSGCVAIALARELPEARFFAVDRSRRALRAARFNAARLGAGSIVWLEGDLFAPLAGRVRRGSIDLVVANPPYVREADWRKLLPEVRDHEPKRALVAGRDGLAVIRRLVAGAPGYLRPGGRLVFEVGAGQAVAAESLFDARWEIPEAVRDLAGIPRIVVAALRRNPRLS
jgi:release factor glutamine methyltransferase